MTTKLKSIQGGQSAPQTDNSDDPIVWEIEWPERETRPLRLGQDAEGGKLLYLQRHPVIEEAAIVVSSDHKIVAAAGHGLRPFGLHPPRCGEKRLKKLMEESDPYGRWSHAASVENSLPKYLSGQGDNQLASLLDDIQNTLQRYLWFRDSRTHLVLSTVILSTYVAALSTVAPYVFLVGAKGTGKTLILELLEAICFNAQLTIPTRPSLYRLTEFYAATLLIDEVRKSIEPSTLSVLKTGYKKSGAVTVTEGRIPRPYSTYGVKVFAGTKGYDDELLDRGIAILCEKAAANAGTASFDSCIFETEEAFPLRNRLHCVALSSASLVHSYLRDNNTADDLRHREREIFMLPAAVCSAADHEDDGGRYEILMDYALENNSRKSQLSTPSKMDAAQIISATIDFVRDAYREVPKHPDCYIAADITERISTALDLPKLTPKKLGAELVQIGLLGTGDEDRPKLYISGDRKSRQCWRLQHDRVNDIANKYGVEV